jgi:hypothetical protein
VILKLGDVVWTCAPTLESRGCCATVPGSLRRVKVTTLPDVDDKRPLVKVQDFNAETGAVDYDASATALVPPFYLYKDEDDALLAYAEELDRFIGDLQEQIADAEENRLKAMKKALGMHAREVTRLTFEIVANEIWDETHVRLAARDFIEIFAKGLDTATARLVRADTIAVLLPEGGKVSGT